MLYTLSASAVLLTVLVALQIGGQRAFARESVKLEKHIHALSKVSIVDRVRAGHFKRVDRVIARFNPGLDAETRFAIANEISNAAMKYENLDVDLICATITHESAFTWDPEITSPKGALGLMQVMPATGQFLAAVEEVAWASPEQVLYDPVLNIRLGSRYLSSLIEMYEIDGGLAAYNGGGKRAEMWLAQNRAHGVLYEETQNYVPAVLSLYEEFQTF